LVVALTAAPLAADSFYAVAPCRVLDTRTTSSPVESNTPTVFGVAGLCGIPVEASSVSFNVTLVPQSISVDLAMCPGDLAAPTNTNVVSTHGAVIAGAAVIPLSDDGQGTVEVLANSAWSGATDLLLDVNGYFAPDTLATSWPGPDSDPGPTDNFDSESYIDTLGQSGGSTSSPVLLVPGQGGAGSHYFVSTSNQPVPLVGVSADNACHFNKTGAGQCNYGNHTQIIDDAVNAGLNVIRLWVNVVGLPMAAPCKNCPPTCAFDSANYDPTDQPFEYDASAAQPPPQGDGLGRWHLDVQNGAYFQRLYDVVSYAASKGTYVEVTIFSPQTPNLYLGPWSPAHAYLKNGTSLGGFTDAAQFVNSSDPKYVKMSPYVLNVVKWTVDALYSFPNVYYEVANEPEWIQPLGLAPCTGWTTQSTTNQTTVAIWQSAIAGELKAEISAKGANQQVGIEASTFTDADQFRSGTRPTQPGRTPAVGPGPYTSSASIINSHYTRLNPLTTTNNLRGDGLGAIRLARGYYSQTKILGFNETKIVASACAEKRGTFEGVNEGRAEAWEFMVNQGGVYDQFGYGCPSSCASPPSLSSSYCETRRQMGAMRKFLAGPVNIGRNLVTSTSGVGLNARPSWINLPPYPAPPALPPAINEFWAAVQPTATALTKRWLLYIHHSAIVNGVFDAYQAKITTPHYQESPPSSPLYVCLGPTSGTYTAQWINPVNPLTPNGTPNPIATQQITWTGTTTCTPGGQGSVKLSPSPNYSYDMVLFIS
jgi:hypothetical protein